MKKSKKPTKAAAPKIDPESLVPPQTREALIELSVATSRFTIERDAAQLKLDRRVLDLEEAYSPPIEAMTAEIDRGVELMRLWALEHRTEEFGERQSLDVAGSKLAFRKGSGKVVADVDEATAVNQLLALPSTFAKERGALLSMTWTLNKQAALAMAKTQEGEAFLMKMGLRVVVEEEFKFIPARKDLLPLPVSGGKLPVEVDASQAA
jgi:phage host-nuclease inhibitor protein Gam